MKVAEIYAWLTIAMCHHHISAKIALCTYSMPTQLNNEQENISLVDIDECITVRLRGTVITEETKITGSASCFM